MTAITDLASLYARLPHAGAMCLIDEVLDWDATGIRCRTVSHRADDHPLRGCDGLACVHGVEYGAQAAALHGVLSDAIDDGPGLLLGAVRDLDLFTARLDNITDQLTLTAQLQLRSGVNAIYTIAVTAGDRPCLRGRLTLLRAHPEAR